MSSFRRAGGADGATVDHDERSNTLHAMAKKCAAHFPQVPLISCTDLRKAMEDPLLSGTLVLVDVRSADETAVSMLPGSMTAAEFDARQERVGKTVVCYCTVGYRSSSFAAKLLQQGWEAKNLEGGCVRWAQKRFPLVARDGREVKRIHVYGKKWSLAPDDIEAVMFESSIKTAIRSLLPAWLGGKKGN